MKIRVSTISNHEFDAAPTSSFQGKFHPTAHIRIRITKMGIFSEATDFGIL